MLKIDTCTIVIGMIYLNLELLHISRHDDSLIEAYASSWTRCKMRGICVLFVRFFIKMHFSFLLMQNRRSHKTVVFKPLNVISISTIHVIGQTTIISRNIKPNELHIFKNILNILLN